MDNKDKVKKGLFRLWLTLSVIWWVIGFIGLIVVANWDGGFHNPTGYLDDRKYDSPFLWEFFIPLFCAAVLPPFILYFFSKACYWIYRGFKEGK